VGKVYPEDVKTEGKVVGWQWGLFRRTARAGRSPTVPFVSVVVVMVGAGETTTFVDIDIDVSATEVADTFTVILEETEVGAL
jgi:hypothetical protein